MKFQTNGWGGLCIFSQNLRKLNEINPNLYIERICI